MGIVTSGARYAQLVIQLQGVSYEHFIPPSTATAL
jgi:hypothetical protein